MTQQLTNYDAEIVNGILRLPPNCAKLTKGERLKVTKMVVFGRLSAWPFPTENTTAKFERYTAKVELIRRKGSRPNVTVWVSVPVKEARQCV